MKKTYAKIAALLAALTIFLAGCGFPGLNDTSKTTIRIAAQNTTEQQILASIDQQMIEHYTKLHATVINNLGSPNINLAALQRGNADMSAARYDGTDLTDILGKTSSGNAAQDRRTVEKAFQKKYGLTYLKSYGFADTFAWMVTEQTAKSKHLNNVSDMGQFATKMAVGIDSSWLKRRGDGYTDFQKKYNFAFGKVYSMQIGLVYDALAAGKMDAVLGYSTDGRINSYHLKILKDDKHFFPPYYAYPVVKTSVLKAHPELKTVLNKLSGKISVTTMQKLNYQVDDQLKEPSVVAKQFLQQHHYFEGSGD